MYTENEARELVIEAGRRLLEKKLVARTWGNISARISEEEFVITPSGKGYEDLRPEDLVAVRIEDCSYEGDTKPSSEKGIHAAAYALKSDIDIVIHTHQYFASVIAAECRSVESAPCAPYALPGTGKLCKNVVSTMKRHPDSMVFLLARHGAFILGKDMEEAFALAEKLEEDCKKMFDARVPSTDAVREESIDIDRVRSKGAPFAAVARDRYLTECCYLGMTLKPYIDDFAQIAGTDIKCVENDIKSINRALKGRNAALVKGVGAVCTGKTPDDADAVAFIVSKNAAAACYVRNAKPLGALDAMLQRLVYVNKYSKQKDR